MPEDYWKWTESRWVDPEADWKQGDIITGGVDVGSVSSQAVVMVDGKLFAYANKRTGSSSPKSAENVMDWALEQADGMGYEDLQYTVGTGYGRVNVPFADRTLSEIACHARGANFMYGSGIRTVLDMGGQDCKAIRCDERGKVVTFLMNDKCAAGTGRGMEVIADLLGVAITEMGKLSFQVEEDPPPVSSTCVVFAKSEAAALLRKGWPKEEVLAAYISAMVHRVATLLARIKIEPEFGITGGIAKNVGVVKRLEKELGVSALTPRYDTQIAGAAGAALFARTLVEKSRKG
jgi:bzd-type benzoyl-CoA reductase Q subunit